MTKQPPNYITQPVEIHKHDIPKTGSLKGKVNSQVYSIGESTFTPGTLVFCGFVGVKVAPLRWAGHYRFLPNGQEDMEMFDFSELPAWREGVEPAKLRKVKNAD